MIDHALPVEGAAGGWRGQKMRSRVQNEMKSNCLLLDFVDSRTQHMALFISITVCIVILALVLLFCYVR